VRTYVVEKKEILPWTRQAGITIRSYHNLPICYSSTLVNPGRTGKLFQQAAILYGSFIDSFGGGDDEMERGESLFAFHLLAVFIVSSRLVLSTLATARIDVHHKLASQLPIFALSSVLATQSTTRSTSSVEVCQLETLTRIARRPRHVVPVKNASPEAEIAAIIRSVKRS
jgi:hypothetical protein